MAEENEGQDQGSGQDDADDQNLNADDDGQQDGEGQDDQDGDDDKPVSRTEFQRLFKRMQAADRAKGEAERKLREKEQAEMSELDRLKAQLEEKSTEAASASDRLKAMIIENAFHRDNKVSWHDVGDAISALDLSGVEIDEDGKVSGMAAAIKELIKRKPHFVKKVEKEEEEGDGSGPPAANNASNGRRKGTAGNNFDRAAMSKRFPALGK